ncbi:MAG: hypothetical protein Q4E61_02645, partial [Alphaproteobacteria bacterium]|nr:hypothetical protein [Alphaproteobacteria bacterium]
MISSYTGVSGSRIAYYIATEFKNKGNLLIVVPTGKSAQRLSEDLGFFMPNINILVMQEEDKNRIVYE